MALQCLKFFAVFGLVLALTSTSRAATLWYNGDYVPNGVRTQSGNSFGYAYGMANYSENKAYDDFVVPALQYWHITEVWSNDFGQNKPFAPVVTQAAWTIRSGVSPSSAGVIVFSGVGNAIQTPTGRTIANAPELTYDVGGISVDLAPGTYWLNVLPIDRNPLSTLNNSATAGFNSEGLEVSGYPGNAVLINASGQIGVDFDASMGIGGSAIAPEPTGVALLTLLLPGILRCSGRRRKRTQGGEA